MILQVEFNGWDILLTNRESEAQCVVPGRNMDFAQELARRWNLGEVKKIPPQIGQPRTGAITREEIRETHGYKALEAKNVPKYPEWICAQCGHKFGHREPECAPFHPGICGWCGVETSVTEPRDYGHPTHPSEQVQ